MELFTRYLVVISLLVAMTTAALLREDTIRTKGMYEKDILPICPEDFPCDCAEKPNPYRPRSSHGRRKANDTLLLVDCRNQSLDDVPDFSFLAERRIDQILLNNNSIEIVKKQAFKRVTVRQLNLSDNNIRTISDRGFDGILGLEELYIADNVITSSPLALRDVPQLKVLDLHNNNMASLQDQSFVELVQLESLDLSENLKIQFPSPFTAFQSLERLQHLNLSRCGLPNLPLDAMEHLINLRSLVMRDNNIRAMPDDIFLANNELEELDLIGNPVQIESGHTAFKGLYNIRRLRFRGCSVPELNQEFFNDIDFRVKLKELILSDCSIGRAQREIFWKMSGLTVLDVSGNPDLRIDANTLKGMEKLIDLSIARMNLTNFPANLFKPLKRIQRLDVSGNFIADLGKRDFNYGKGNVEIFLSDNNIENISNQLLFNWTGRVTLDLRGNNITNITFIADDPCRFHGHSVDLSDNPIECDCGVFEMSQMKPLGIIGACAEPVEFRNLSLAPTESYETSYSYFEFDRNAKRECLVKDRRYERFDCLCQDWVPLHQTLSKCKARASSSGAVNLMSNLKVPIVISLVMCLAFKCNW